MEKDKSTSSKAKSHSDKPVPDSSRSAKASTDSKIAKLEHKWSARFSQLEALPMAKTLDKEPTFQTVKVVPSHSPPPGAVRTNPFIRPTNHPFSLHLLQSIFLEPTHLLPSISLLAKHVLTCHKPTNLQLQLVVRTLLPLINIYPARHHPDLSGRTVFPVRNQKLRVNCLTSLLLISM